MWNAQFPEKEYINGIFLAVQCSGSANIPFVSGSRDPYKDPDSRRILPGHFCGPLKKISFQ
jgi:hypothetical protein